jgi:hypothetical protein
MAWEKTPRPDHKYMPVQIHRDRCTTAAKTPSWTSKTWCRDTDKEVVTCSGRGTRLG